MPGQAPDRPGVVHPRQPPRRATARAQRWWGKAWVRAVEESAYAERDLAAARSLSRSGRVGAVQVGAGSAVAVVEGDAGPGTVEIAVPVLDEAAAQALVETVAAQAGRVTALLAGDLPHELVEHAEEAGVELLPYGGELGTSCTCEAWVDPCVHALAVLYQLTWLMEADPFVLVHLRGLSREELLARLHALGPPAGHQTGTAPAASVEPEDEEDLATAYDAAARAARVLELLEADEGGGSLSGLDHLF